MLKSGSLRLWSHLLMHCRIWLLEILIPDILTIWQLIIRALDFTGILKLSFILHTWSKTSTPSTCLAVVVFNLVKCYEIWMGLLHLILSTMLIRRCSIFAWREILRTVHILISWSSHYTSSLIVMNCQLTHLLHLRLACEAYSASLRRYAAYPILSRHPLAYCASFIAWAHEIVPGHPEIY